MLGGAAENLIGGSGKRIYLLVLKFGDRMLLKGAVAHSLFTLSEPHMNRKLLPIICSMLSRGILKHFPCCRHLLQIQDKTQTVIIERKRKITGKKKTGGRT